MNDGTTTAAQAAQVEGLAEGSYLQYGDHVDTIDMVDTVFSKQRRLSFAYGAVFFGVTLLIPVLTNWLEPWYATPIWGGFTWNYLIVSLIYYVFLWTMAWTYSQQADRLDERLHSLADEREAQLKASGKVSAGGDAS